jgi:predicted dehydrogenase/threonine dehydrogenase-like Zn-dependent dehydrogenase
MKQLIQDFKTGELYVDDLDIPAISKGMVLVENHFSLISAGTEKSTVDVAKASLINKAKKRPDLVKQVIQNYRKEGLMATIQKVRTKLSSLKALGYSTAGTVVSSMDTNGKFPPGTRVACGGADYASHASFVSVPQNLVARVPDNVTLEEAAFTTLGAIALQGVRQANPTLGESVCVIGLGLLGQITCQLLHANGCKVFGVDISNASVDFTNKNKYAVAYNRGDGNLKSAALDFSNGYGFDKVIITAGAPNNDPIVLATELLRRKGQVILVGAVPMDIPREPHFYRKELELKISCSYGPGRYDVKYEEEGTDYPIGYVRWTEQRNMEAFLDLLSMKMIDVKPLITHTFDIEHGMEAYDIILGKKKEPYIGMLLRYSEESKRTLRDRKPVPAVAGKLNIGFIGAGSFAQSYLLPNAKAIGSLDTVVTRTGVNAKNVATKFGFANHATDADVILKNQGINTVFIATQHDTHAKYVIEGLKHNKAVFVEKPLALSYEELEAVKDAYASHPNNLMVGFNRRFSEIAVRAKKEFASVTEPLVMNFRVNAGFIPKDHWTQREAGGGRILGEVCHFIDLMQFFAGSEPVKVYAECIDSVNDTLKNDDNIAVVVKFANGSVGNLTYLANGDKAMPKELLEIFGGNVSFTINDFKQGVLYRNNKEIKIANQGKGHKQEVEAFLHAIQKGEGSPIDFESLYTTTLVTLKIIDSLNTGLPQFMHSHEQAEPLAAESAVSEIMN